MKNIKAVTTVLTHLIVLLFQFSVKWSSEVQFRVTHLKTRASTQPRFAFWTHEFRVHACVHTHKTDLQVYPLNSISLFALRMLIKCIYIRCMFVCALLYMHREENQIDATE